MNDSVKFFFAKIIHNRLGEIPHRFLYKSFFVSIPITSISEPYGNLLFGINRYSILSVSKKNYGNGKGFKEWVINLLGEKNFSRPIYKIWLSTTPKILGLGFNPVSFWFCEDKYKNMIGIIAEVNNTFGEKKCYVLKKNMGDVIKNGETIEADKSFYVSPFIEVKGVYKFRFYRDDKKKIETTRIELKIDDKPLMITSLSGRVLELDNLNGLLKLMKVLFSPVITLSRINFQALILWLKGIKIVDRQNVKGNINKE